MTTSSCKWPEIEKFLKHPIYPGQFDVSTKELAEHALGVPSDMKMFYVNGSPIECTLECDYSTINVSGSYHRLYVIGIRNQINFSGTCHQLYCEGFHNQINFCTDVPNGQVSVQGDNSFAFLIGVSNGKIDTESPMKLRKLNFPSSLKDRRRRRLMWKPVNELDDCEVLSEDEQEPDAQGEAEYISDDEEPDTKDDDDDDISNDQEPDLYNDEDDDMDALVAI